MMMCGLQNGGNGHTTGHSMFWLKTKNTLTDISKREGAGAPSNVRYWT